MYVHRKYKNIRYKTDPKGGWLVSDDGGKTWYFTQRTEQDIQDQCDRDAVVPVTQEPDLEIFGETLDEEIPEEFHPYLV